jgi:serine/threonine protein kinase/tetratricopeptide (TPR) repeat protein
MWSLFHAALDIAPEGRGAFLDTACEGDQTLRRQVSELLASHDRPGGPLDRTPADGVTPQADVLVGERVGDYRILARIGEGGMGIVYDAEQQAPIRRRVALKAIHPGMHPDLAARFAVERQALAVMSHPNIARVFDAGVLPDGRPFLAMEHVAGVPLGEYCDRHSLDLGQRIDLFVSVCQAIQHAHQKGVIHRDVKPSNILVAVEDGAPVPKVIDFGVAKAFHATLDDQALRTRQEVLIGTLEYMSPEQLDPSGLDVDTRSDVYSLGVVLYELLAGALPFDWPSVRQEGLEGLRRVARESDPPRASRRLLSLGPEPAGSVAARRRTTPAALARRLTGDLDWILLKALDRDRTRRYGAASDLAADLRRHLAQEPVQAGPPGAGYRISKLVRRHRTAVAVAAAGMMLLTAFLVTTLVQSAEIRSALTRADRERARAERVAQFLVDVFKASDPYQGNRRDLTAREVLDRGAERVARELADEPDVKAAVMSAVGRVYAELGIYDSAERLLRESLVLRRRLYVTDHPAVAESLEALGAVMRNRADYPSAAGLLEEAVAMRRRLGDTSGLARSLYSLGSLRRLQGELAAAETLLDEALALARAPRAAGTAADPFAATPILEELGAVAWKKGDYAKGEASYREALALRREKAVDAPRTAATLGRLGTLLSERGDLEAAEPLLRESLELLERHLGPDHGDLAPSLNNLALLLQNRSDYAGAEPLYRRALAIDKHIRGDAHPSVAIDLNNLGLLLHDQGRFREAEALFRDALAVQRRVLREGHPDLAYPTTNLARVVHDQGRFAEAEALYRSGLELRRKGLPARHAALGDSLAWLGKLMTDKGQPVSGEPLLREAVDVRAAGFATDDWRTAEARSLLGACLAAQQRFAEAEPLLVESYPILERKRGKAYRRTRQALERIVRLYEAWGRPQDAARYRAVRDASRPAGGSV